MLLYLLGHHILSIPLFPQWPFSGMKWKNPSSYPWPFNVGVYQAQLGPSIFSIYTHFLGNLFLSSCRQRLNLYLQTILFLPKFRFSIILRGLKDISSATCLYRTPHLCSKLTALTAFLFQLITSLAFKLLRPESSVILNSSFSHAQHSSIRKFCWLYFQHISGINFMSHYFHCHHNSLNKYRFSPGLLQQHLIGLSVSTFLSVH